MSSLILLLAVSTLPLSIVVCGCFGLFCGEGWWLTENLGYILFSPAASAAIIHQNDGFCFFLCVCGGISFPRRFSSVLLGLFKNSWPRKQRQKWIVVHVPLHPNSALNSGAQKSPSRLLFRWLACHAFFSLFSLPLFRQFLFSTWGATTATNWVMATGHDKMGFLNNLYNGLRPASKGNCDATNKFLQKPESKARVANQRSESANASTSRVRTRDKLKRRRRRRQLARLKWAWRNFKPFHSLFETGSGKKSAAVAAFSSKKGRSRSSFAFFIP